MLRTASLLAAACAAAASVPAQVLVMTNATTDTLQAFSLFDGSLVNATLFPIANTTMVSAIDVGGAIWISEQVNDRVTRYDAAGNVLGTIGPTFSGGGLDNVRGMAFVNGLVYVTNSGTANGAAGNAVVVFDAAGNFVQTINTTGTVTSPFSVMPFQGDLLVGGSGNANDIHRFTTSGTPVSIFHNSAAISFVHQIAPAADGNVWCAAFTAGGISKIDAATGAVLLSFPAAGARGVYELGNGNVMWTNGTGAWVHDLATATSTQVVTGSCFHLNVFGAAPAAAVPYGAGCQGLALASGGLPRVGRAGFNLRLDNVAATSPLGLFAFGSSALNPGIDLTLLGMAGCTGYVSLDIGVFAGGLTAAGTSLFALPIPNNGALAGVTLATQGIAFTPATSLGLAASNGLSLTIGY